VFLYAATRKRDRLDTSRDLRRHLLIFGTYVVIPVALVCAVSLAFAPYSFLVPRYFLPFIAGYHQLVAIAISRMDRRVAFVVMLVFALAPVIKAAKHWQSPEVVYSRIASALPAELDQGTLIAHLSPMSYYCIKHYRQDRSSEEKVLW